jgi:hypothetical protein
MDNQIYITTEEMSLMSNRIFRCNLYMIVHRGHRLYLYMQSMNEYDERTSQKKNLFHSV